MIGRDFAGYRIDAQIGQGGIGVVYRALDQKLGRPVALKLLRAEAVGPTQRPRFEREAKALAALSHPNVVKILDCGVSDSIPYLVMELLEGQSLAQALGPTPFPLPRAERLMRELLAALAYVHERGLVHRDLKPANAFLQRLPDGGEQLKLLDFGLAKFLDPEEADNTVTRTGEVFGTPAYMPPEQWTGDKVDASADVYSAAVVCFEMLAGRKPFLGEGHDLLRSTLIDAPPALHDACKDRVARPELERFLQRALAKRARERQPNAIELAKELETMARPWLYEGKDATAERRAAATAAHAAADIGTAPTIDQRTEDAVTLEGATRLWKSGTRAEPKARRPSAIFEGLRKLALLSAWTLSALSLLIIGVAATMIYLSRSDDHPEARERLQEAIPPLRDAVAHGASVAKGAVEQAVSSAAERIAQAVPEQAQNAPQEEGAVPEQAVAAIKRAPARNPWRAPTPRALRKARTKIEAGQRGDNRMISDLRRYNREQPNDPRAHLLLGRMFVTRGAWEEVVVQYKLAFDRDPSSRGDPRMLRDLVGAAARKDSSARAIEVIPIIYGPEALEAIALARSHLRSTDERERLDRLARALSP